MEFELYSIYDSATMKYTVPMAQDNDAVAMRAFAHEAMRPESYWNSHPQDYILYRVGIFDIVSGEITPCKPERICSAAELISRKES